MSCGVNFLCVTPPSETPGDRATHRQFSPQMRWPVFDMVEFFLAGTPSHLSLQFGRRRERDGLQHSMYILIYKVEGVAFRRTFSLPHVSPLPFCAGSILTVRGHFEVLTDGGRVDFLSV